jgi:hypothetical protein
MTIDMAVPKFSFVERLITFAVVEAAPAPAPVPLPCHAFLCFRCDKDDDDDGLEVVAAAAGE